MKLLRRFETWLIIMAVVASLVISCSGCTRAEPAAQPRTPEPSREIAHYQLRTPLDYDNAYVIEFRDSAGRVCTLVLAGRDKMLSCARPLPPLNYEDLPPAEGESK